MEPSETWISVLFFILFLLLSAFFSSAETAFTAINKFKLRTLIDKKTKGAKTIALLLKSPKKLLTGILVGNNIANVAASAIATKLLLDWIPTLNLGINIAIELVIVTIIVTSLLLFFGEITPKSIAIKVPAPYAAAISHPLKLFLIILKPITYLFSSLTIVVYKILKIPTNEITDILSQDEMNTVLNLAKEEGLLEEQEKEMIHSIFNFGDKIVREIMTPRTDTICINSEYSINDVIEIILEKGHSRIPVFEERLDNIIGIIYAKDLLSLNQNEKKSTLSSHIREAVFIPETKNIVELLTQMKTTKFHMAIVVDEHGGMSGIVTLEDIIEEVLGEIQDEYDKDTIPELKKTGPNTYNADAKVNIDTLSEKIDIEFPGDDDFDTLGGFILSTLGRFPEVNEEINYKNITIIVKEVSKHRITKLKLKVTPKNSQKDIN